MIRATAMMEASSSGQIGQPAAWMMANKALSFGAQMHFRARTLAKPHVSSNFGSNTRLPPAAPDIHKRCG